MTAQVAEDLSGLQYFSKCCNKHTDFISHEQYLVYSRIFSSVISMDLERIFMDCLSVCVSSVIYCQLLDPNSTRKIFMADMTETGDASRSLSHRDFFLKILWKFEHKLFRLSHILAGPVSTNMPKSKTLLESAIMQVQQACIQVMECGRELILATTPTFVSLSPQLLPHIYKIVDICKLIKFEDLRFPIAQRYYSTDKLPVTMASMEFSLRVSRTGQPTPDVCQEKKISPSALDEKLDSVALVIEQESRELAVLLGDNPGSIPAMGTLSVPSNDGADSVEMTDCEGLSTSASPQFGDILLLEDGDGNVTLSVASPPEISNPLISTEVTIIAETAILRYSPTIQVNSWSMTNVCTGRYLSVREDGSVTTEDCLVLFRIIPAGDCDDVVHLQCVSNGLFLSVAKDTAALARKHQAYGEAFALGIERPELLRPSTEDYSLSAVSASDATTKWIVDAAGQGFTIMSQSLSVRLTCSAEVVTIDPNHIPSEGCYFYITATTAVATAPILVGTQSRCADGLTAGQSEDSTTVTVEASGQLEPPQEALVELNSEHNANEYAEVVPGLSGYIEESLGSTDKADCDVDGVQLELVLSDYDDSGVGDIDDDGDTAVATVEASGVESIIAATEDGHPEPVTVEASEADDNIAAAEDVHAAVIEDDLTKPVTVKAPEADDNIAAAEDVLAAAIEDDLTKPVTVKAPEADDNIAAAEVVLAAAIEDCHPEPVTVEASEADDNIAAAEDVHAEPVNSNDSGVEMIADANAMTPVLRHDCDLSIISSNIGNITETAADVVIAEQTEDTAELDPSKSIPSQTTANVETVAVGLSESQDTHSKKIDTARESVAASEERNDAFVSIHEPSDSAKVEEDSAELEEDSAEIEEDSAKVEEDSAGNAVAMASHSKTDPTTHEVVLACTGPKSAQCHEGERAVGDEVSVGDIGAAPAATEAREVSGFKKLYPDDESSTELELIDDRAASQSLSDECTEIWPMEKGSIGEGQREEGKELETHALVPDTSLLVHPEDPTSTVASTGDPAIMAAPEVPNYSAQDFITVRTPYSMVPDDWRGVFGVQLPDTVYEQWRVLFSEADATGRGFLELDQVVAIHAKQYPDDFAVMIGKAQFAAADRKGRGVVTFQDLVFAIAFKADCDREATIKAIKKAFAAVDTDHDDIIPVSEVELVLSLLMEDASADPPEEDMIEAVAAQIETPTCTSTILVSVLLAVLLQQPMSSAGVNLLGENTVGTHSQQLATASVELEEGDIERLADELHEMMAGQWDGDAIDEDAVIDFLEAYAIEDIEKIVRHPDWQGDTAVSIAAAKGRAACLQYLLDRGGDAQGPPNSNGYTPLMSACMGGHLECVKLLCDSGIDVSVVSLDGHTALQLAQQRDSQACADYILSVAVSRTTSFVGGASS